MKRTVSSTLRGETPPDQDTSSAQLRRSIRSAISAMADNITDNPQDDIMGPVLATVASTVKDMIPDPETDSGFAEGTMPARLPKGVIDARPLARSKTPPMTDPTEVAETSKQWNKLKQLLGDQLRDIPEEYPQIRKKLMDKAEYDPKSGLVNNPEALTKPDTIKYK